MTASPNPSAPGQPVVFTATLTVTATGAVTPTGAVTFTVDGIAQRPVPLAVVHGRALAVFTTAGLGAGTHAVTAAYGGDPGFAPSTSNSVTQVVNPPPVVVSLRRLGIHLQPTHLVLTFNRPMNVAIVQDLRNYLLYRVGPHGFAGPHPRPIPIDSAVYDPAHRTVTLTTRFRLALAGYYLLSVNGAGPGRLADVAGVPLVGTNAGGQIGSEYIAVVHGSGPWLTPSSVEQVRTASAVPAGPRSLAGLAAWS